jgi:hypothetical protein
MQPMRGQAIKRRYSSREGQICSNQLPHVDSEFFYKYLRINWFTFVLS